MHRIERRNRKLERRKQNKLRKAYLREERQSLKRKKREEKKLARQRQKKYKTSFLKRLLLVFGIRSLAEPQDEISKTLGVKEPKNHQKEERIKMRRQLRRNRLKRWKRSWKELFRSPGKAEKISENEKKIRKRIKQDIRQQRQKNLINLPGRVRDGILHFFRRREQRFKYNTQGIKKGLSDFGGFWRSREQRVELLKVLINSTSLYLFAFGFIYYLSQLVTVFTAKFYDIPSVLYSYRIFWPLYTYSSLYTRPALILIFGTGPLIALLVTFGSYRLFLISRRYRFNVKVLFLWIIFHGLNSFFGAYIAGVITRTGFVYTTEWIFLSNVFDVEEIIFLIVSIVVLITAGVFFARLHLTSASSGVLIERKTRLYFIISQVLLPGLIGVGVLFGVNYPKNPPELLLLYGASFLMIIPVLTNYNSPSNEMINRPVKNYRVSIGWIYIFFVIILLIFLRSGLFSGVSFG
ncbi:MAG: hypothetical protein R2750_10625 [Bacteroidales bacterium]